MTASSHRRAARLLLLGALLLLPACAGVADFLSPICTHDVQPGGVIESDLFGFIPIADTPPAEAGLIEGVVEGWNAAHGGALPPRIPWTSILGLILSGGSMGNLLTAKLRQSGQANIAVIKDRKVSWWQTVLAGLAILAPVPGLMPTTAKAKIASGEVPHPAEAAAAKG
jgi:hypothetical protein